MLDERIEFRGGTPNKAERYALEEELKYQAGGRLLVNRAVTQLLRSQ